MSGPMLILPLAAGVYSARDERGLSARGSSPEEALANLRKEVERHLGESRQNTIFTPSGGEHPWAKWAGGWDPNDPVIQEWQKVVEEYRRQADSDPNVY